MINLLVTGQFAPELVPIETHGSDEQTAVLRYPHSMERNPGKYSTIRLGMFAELRDGTMKTSWRITSTTTRHSR